MGLNHLPILLILAVVALVVFGPKRLPELGHGLGKAITEFKKGTAELTHSHDSATEVASPVAAIAPAPGEAHVSTAAPVVAEPVAQPAAEPVARA